MLVPSHRDILGLFCGSIQHLLAYDALVHMSIHVCVCVCVRRGCVRLHTRGGVIWSGSSTAPNPSKILSGSGFKALSWTRHLRLASCYRRCAFCVCLCVHTYMCQHAYTHIHTHKHMHTNPLSVTHTHIHTHARTQVAIVIAHESLSLPSRYFVRVCLGA